MGPRVGEINSSTHTNPQSGVDVITAQRGDTLEKISKRENIPISDLKDANPKIDPKKPLNQGQDVNYPKDLLVQKGEKTLEQVADRLGMPRDVLVKANQGHIKDPNNLREGQSIKLPKDFQEVKDRGTPIKEKRITKNGVNLPGGAGKITGGDGGVVYRPPKVRIGGVDVPLPDVVITDGKGPGVNKTDDKYDGTGGSNTTRRREEDKNINNTRQKDERDVDPRKDNKKPKVETEKLPRSSQDSEEKLQIKKSSNDPKQLDEELQKRLQEKAIDFVRKGGRL
ncbi:MAG TPA: LysM peptidoglycan-binding domain-containing protein [Acidobacteriota bacterium]|nr:LysM peptidoglycan-binding domain-containing protein [Acidobacteriota bacterium]